MDSVQHGILGRHTQEAGQSTAVQKNTENTPALVSGQDTSWGKDLYIQ